VWAQLARVLAAVVMVSVTEPLASLTGIA